MAVISMFYGIIISMFYFNNRRHKRPHIHAKYQNHEAVIAIPEGEILEGSLPSNKMKLVQAWIEIHGDREKGTGKILTELKTPANLFSYPKFLQEVPMPRIPRIFVKGPNVAYHVISRTALDGFVLGPQEKDYLLSLFRWLSSVFFVEVFGFCIMGNHFHLLCRMLPHENFSDDEVLSRVKRYYGEEHEIKDLSPEKILYWRKRLEDLSRYVQEIKQRFSRWFNKRKGRKGYFWGDRFKSVIIETGEALLNCLAYIDLNPVRAGLVERPEEYRWCSLAYHIGTGNKGRFLSTDLGVAAFTNKGYRERIGLYREYVYEKGGISDGSVGAIPEEVLEEEREKGYRLTRKEVFRYRVRYFTEGLIIGSREFVRETTEKVRELLKLKRERRPRKVGLVEGLYSFRAVP